MKELLNFFIDNWDKVLMIFVGFIAIIVYKMQKVDEKRSAAILVSMQINDLKNKIPNIIEIINNNMLNSTGIYETLDFLQENQWNKYKHLFVRDIDMNSLKIIDDFYASVSLIREQLILSKQLQQQSFFNNQQLLGQDCNYFLLQMIDNKNTVNNMPEENKNIEDNNLQDNKKQICNTNTNQASNGYREKVDELKLNYGKQGLFISYLPEQARVTIDKELSKLSHIEIIGSSGYKKLKEIAKIK